MKTQNKFHVESSGGKCTDIWKRRSDKQAWWKYRTPLQVISMLNYLQYQDL